MNTVWSGELFGFVALIGVACGALCVALLWGRGNAEQVALAEAPAVVRWSQVLMLALGGGFVTAVFLTLLGTVFLAPLGFVVGGFIALSVRAGRLRAWGAGITRELQALVGTLVIELDSGEGSLYRGLEVALAEGEYMHLRPLLETHVLARVAAGAPLEDALLELSAAPYLAPAPVVADALRRLGDLAGRDLPVVSLLDALRIMDGVLTDIVRVEQDQAAQSAQIRYSAYIVGFMVVALAALLILVARDLGAALLQTVPGNIALSVVTVMVLTGLARAEYSARADALRF